MNERLDTTRQEVSILSYRFEPSEMLANELHSIVIPGSTAGFTFQSTKEAFVDSSLYSLEQYHKEQEVISSLIEKNKRKKIIIGDVALKSLSRNAGRNDGEVQADTVRIALAPHDAPMFNTLVKPLGIFPDIVPRTEPENHYLYADLPSRAIRTDEDFIRSGGLEQASARLHSLVKSSTRSELFSASLIGLKASSTSLPTHRLRPAWRAVAPIGSETLSPKG